MTKTISGRFRRLKALVKWFNHFIKDDLWELNVQALSKTKARLVRDLMVTVDAVRGMNEKNLGLLSVSLCYFCTLALVPFLAVCFAVTGGLGLSDSLTDMLYANFADNPRIIDMVVGAADNILKTARSGGFGLLSALLFVWLVIWMMDRIEKVFNVIWDVPQPKKDRKVLKSYSIDIAIMILAPFIILVFFAGSVIYSNVLDYFLPQKEAFSASIRTFLGWVIFGASIVMIISAMYKFIPTAKVEYRHALRAAMIAGTAFTLLQYLYLETQVLVFRVNSVYGAIAAIPLFLLWLRFGWLIIVIGVQISRSFQNIESNIKASDLSYIGEDTVAIGESSLNSGDEPLSGVGSTVQETLNTDNG
ncbi:MAG: YihY/virulence factor BrkB family protein [Bacteroidales bacterium]|nr:YihY/virulence factor BrkB family protein [Bacteroidales bacterium]